MKRSTALINLKVIKELDSMFVQVKGSLYSKSFLPVIVRLTINITYNIDKKNNTTIV